MKKLITKAAPTEFTFSPNTYAGEALAGYQAKALLAGGLIERGLISVINNVKSKRVLRSLEDSFEFQTPSARFVAQASPNVAVGERYLDPVAYEVMKEYSFAALKTSWEAQALKPGELNDYDGTVDLSNYLMEYMLPRIAVQNEQLYLLGKGSNALFTFSSSYTGLLPLMSADSAVTKITPGAAETFAVSAISAAATPVVTVSSTTNLRDGDIVTVLGVAGTGGMAAALNGNSYSITIASSTTFNLNGVTTAGMGTTPTFASAKVICINQVNAIGVLTNIFQRIPDALRKKADIKIYVPLHVEAAYKLSQATGINVVGGFVDDKKLEFLGQSITPMPYWLPNTIVIACVSNLFLGVDLLSDESMVRTWDLSETTGDQLTRFKCGMKSDVNYMFPTEILMYKPA